VGNSGCWRNGRICICHLVRNRDGIPSLLDLGHYNFSSSPICHYNSSIRIYAITIPSLLDMCHFVRIWCSWVHSQASIFSYGPNCPCYLSSLCLLTCGSPVIFFLFPFFFLSSPLSFLFLHGVRRLRAVLPHAPRAALVHAPHVLLLLVLVAWK